MAGAPTRKNNARGRWQAHVAVQVSSESVYKKLAVLNYLASSKNMPATIKHFYPTLTTSSYNDKRTTILRWVRQQNSCRLMLLSERAITRRCGKGALEQLFLRRARLRLPSGLVSFAEMGSLILTPSVQQHAASINVVLLKIPPHTTPV